MCVGLTWLFHTTAISGVQLSSRACSITVVSTCTYMYMCMHACIHSSLAHLLRNGTMYVHIKADAADLFVEDLLPKMHAWSVFNIFVFSRKMAILCAVMQSRQCSSFSPRMQVQACSRHLLPTCFNAFSWERAHACAWWMAVICFFFWFSVEPKRCNKVWSDLNK